MQLRAPSENGIMDFACVAALPVGEAKRAKGHELPPAGKAASDGAQPSEVLVQGAAAGAGSAFSLSWLCPLAVSEPCTHRSGSNLRGCACVRGALLLVGVSVQACGCKKRAKKVEGVQAASSHSFLPFRTFPAQSVIPHTPTDLCKVVHRGVHGVDVHPQHIASCALHTLAQHHVMRGKPAFSKGYQGML